MTENAKTADGLKPYPDDRQGLSPTVKTVDPDRPASEQKPRGDGQTSSPDKKP